MEADFWQAGTMTSGSETRSKDSVRPKSAIKRVSWADLTEEEEEEAEVDGGNRVDGREEMGEKKKENSEAEGMSHFGQEEERESPVMVNPRAHHPGCQLGPQRGIVTGQTHLQGAAEKMIML